MNPDAAIYLGTIAAIALVLKVTILFNIKIRSKVTECFTLVCLFFILQNAAEFLGYFTYLKSTSLGEFFIHLYMISLFYLFPSILILALALTKSKNLNLSRIILYSLATALTAIYLTGRVVTGFQYLGWSVRTVGGSHYWLAMSLILISSFLTVAHLTYHLLKNLDPEIRYNARINLFAFLPIGAVAFIVLFLRMAGFDSSSAISLPIATLLFLYVMLLHTSGNLFWLSTKLRSVIAVLRMNRSSSFELVIREIEKIRIQEALKVTSGQQKSAAKILGLTASTLNKRISKYNIDVSGFKKPA